MPHATQASLEKLKTYTQEIMVEIEMGTNYPKIITMINTAFLDQNQKDTLRSFTKEMVTRPTQGNLHLILSKLKEDPSAGMNLTGIQKVMNRLGFPKENRDQLLHHIGRRMQSTTSRFT